MDFFAHQEQAQRNTGRLIIFFSLAVLSIAAAVNSLLWLVFQPTDRSELLSLLFLGSVAVMTVILLGSLWRFFSLRGGGRHLAEMLGAQPVRGNSQKAHYQRLHNIVEEMAIASGMPMPALYVLEEEVAINAFVAGYQPSEAVMVVTRGALLNLDRDELQGVVAHEFSHIFHGDMRLNLRLIAILGGLMFITQIGSLLARAGSRSRDGAAFALMGLGLMAVGFIGVLFGELIKAGVSRQREFLADASAVQYTRNPAGLQGALRKIQAHSSQLQSSHAIELSHLCFGSSVNFWGWLATHPPLAVRIERLGGATQNPTRAMPDVTADAGAPESAKLSGLAFLAAIGQPSPAHLAYAQDLLAQKIPLSLLNQTRDPEEAQVLVFALLLKEHQGSFDAWQTLLSKTRIHAVTEKVQRSAAILNTQAAEIYLPLLNLAVPALKALSAAERQDMRALVAELIECDAQLTVFEYLVSIALDKHLSPVSRPRGSGKYQDFSAVTWAVSQTLSVLSAGDAAAFQTASARLQIKVSQLRQDDDSIKSLSQALQQLAQLSPARKRDFLQACADCVLHDGKVSVQEGELIRLVAEVLDCPLPPLQV